MGLMMIHELTPVGLDQEMVETATSALNKGTIDGFSLKEQVEVAKTISSMSEDQVKSVLASLSKSNIGLMQDVCGIGQTVVGHGAKIAQLNSKLGWVIAAICVLGAGGYILWKRHENRMNAIELWINSTR